MPRQVKSVCITAWVDPDIATRLAVLAEELGISRSAAIRLAVTQLLLAEEKERKETS